MSNSKSPSGYLILFIVISFSFAFHSSCKTKAESTTQPFMSYSVIDTVPVKKGEQLRLMISLLSAGEGPDRQASDQISKIISDYCSEIKKPVQYVLVPWGREGETDFCFRLTNLDAKQQAVFIEKVKKLFEGRSLVFVSENEACRHIRY